MSHAIKLPLTYIGQTITQPVGRVVIALTWLREGIYRVTINNPSPCGVLGAEADGCSYPTEDEARAEARRAFRAYTGGATVDQLAARREELAVLIEAWVKRPGPEALARTRRLEAEADLLQPLQAAADDRTLAAAVVDTMAATYDRALRAA